jgi:hypothetical protein
MEFALRENVLNKFTPGPANSSIQLRLHVLDVSAIRVITSCMKVTYILLFRE